MVTELSDSVTMQSLSPAAQQAKPSLEAELVFFAVLFTQAAAAQPLCG
jgi:hypothetical protein